MPETPEHLNATTTVLHLDARPGGLAPGEHLQLPEKVTEHDKAYIEDGSLLKVDLTKNTDAKAAPAKPANSKQED